MLYDPKWEQKTETNHDPWSRESLIAWLEKQPAHESYNYRDCSGLCMVGLYAASLGLGWYKDQIGLHPKFSAFNSIACGEVDDLDNHGNWQPGTRTFGAALARARKLAA